MTKPLLILITSLILLRSSTGFAAACCGGSSSAPAIITTDDRAQVSLSMSHSEVAVDSVDSRGIWHRWDDHQQSDILKIESALLLSDRWQIGSSISNIHRNRLEQNYSGIGDIIADLGYEYLPDWDYNPLRPKGLGFFQVTIPTGKNKAESDLGGLDSSGNGFWSLGIGTLLTKSWQRYDFFSSFEIHKSFEKKFANSLGESTLNPQWGGSFAIGAGYNVKDWRWGLSLTNNYEDAIATSGAINNSGSIERYSTLATSFSYLANDDWAGTISYADQTILGSPVNTSLGKSVALLIQRKWGR